LLIEADSLFDKGNYGDAQLKYNKIKASFPGSPEARSALYALGTLHIYYKNPNGDWNAALNEFKLFAAQFPKDPRSETALSWVRVLTVLKSFDMEFKRASDQVERLKLGRSEFRQNQRISLDSMSSLLQRNYEARDSLAKKNTELENVIIDLEKKCQQAGR
jgi:outer membrane protein assembly factor BamD (BamD/ComL family)